MTGQIDAFAMYQNVHAALITMKRCDMGVFAPNASEEVLGVCGRVATAKGKQRVGPNHIVDAYWCDGCILMFDAKSMVTELPVAMIVRRYNILTSAPAASTAEDWVQIARDLVTTFPPCIDYDWKSARKLRSALSPEQQALMTEQQWQALTDSLKIPNTEHKTCLRCEVVGGSTNQRERVSRLQPFWRIEDALEEAAA